MANFQYYQEATFYHTQEEKEEDVLSNPEEKLSPNNQENNNAPSLDSSDLFEFFNEFTSEMSHAEDIIFCGYNYQLIPNKTRHPMFDDRRTLKYSSLSSRDYGNTLSRRSCESLPELNRSRSNGVASSKLTRSSCSLDGNKLRRNSSLVMTSHVEAKNTAKFEVSDYVAKPRWYRLMFGITKFPFKMDLRDMKSRQFRRATGSVFRESAPEARGDRKSSWGVEFLNVLSCKTNASLGTSHYQLCCTPRKV